ncbi:chloroplast cysteine synthase [Cinnamomum micranthum f. kanehirae]|uniref:Chloroplast cysteine synthase n=1 Tax=Cinnamomum micranthum f. kanehirae TaxID=337451 RepID=A0A3S3MGG8_9MAGN|nr:chloroplast cysteine synthase [Cinnamomum micranthum f. kanehirae]
MCRWKSLTPYCSLFQLIGRTPLVYLNKVSEGCGGHVAAKLEMMQPCSSIKDRPAFAMIEAAEKQGLISPGKTVLIEPTSGNMGIGLAFMAALKGYKLIPQKAWEEQVKKAYDLMETTPGAYMLQQFEILSTLRCTLKPQGLRYGKDTLGQVDIFVMGIGSGGTVSGVGRYLKSKNPNVKVLVLLNYNFTVS